MYATRSRTAAAKTAAAKTAAAKTAAKTAPKAVADLPVKVQRKALLNMVDVDDVKLARQYQLEDREKALAEREKALVEREKALAKREKELAKREKALENAREMTPKKSKKITVIYTAKYRGEDPDFEKIGEFADEKNTIAGVITWLVKNSKGGFDVWNLNEYMKDREDCEFAWHGSYDLSEKEVIEFLVKKCKTWDDLRTVCSDWGNSWFEDEDGWFLRKI